jgi:hypothetical protein
LAVEGAFEMLVFNFLLDLCQQYAQTKPANHMAELTCKSSLDYWIKDQ